MKEQLKMLKLGATKSGFPVYGNYVESDGKTLRTCNDEIFVTVDYEAPFIGATNIFVLDEIIKNLNDVEITQNGNILEVRAEGYKTELNIAEVSVPYFTKPNVKFINIDSDILQDLKLASRYVSPDFNGVKGLDKVYVGDCICGTNGSRVFYRDYRYANTVDTIGLSSKVIGLLSEGMKIGGDTGNVLVDFDFGYILSISDIMDSYPLESIKMVIDSSKQNVKRLCNVAKFQDAIPKLLPIFFGEGESVVKIRNEANKLIINAESAVNGKSEVVYESEMEESFNVFMNLNYIKDIPLDYDVFVNVDKEEVKKLYFINDVSVIVVMGCEK